MAIVLNEREWAEEVIESRRMRAPALETLGRLARYWRQACGYQKAEIRRRLEDFVLSCDPDSVLIKWEKTIEKAVKSCDRYSLIEIESVPVTDREIETISSIGRRQEERLAFTLLCVAKYWNMASENNNCWVNEKESDLFKMANVTTRSDKRDMMFNDLYSRGLIALGKRVDSLNVQVLFMDSELDGESTVVLEVDDFRNLGNQYHMLRGESFLRCTNCGLCVKRGNGSQKYCKDCARAIYVKQSVDSVMRKRGRKSV